MPPANLYDNLRVYQSVAVYEDGEEVPFTGTDYFYIDTDTDGDLWVLFFDPDFGKWYTAWAFFVEQISQGTKYDVENPDGEELTFIISSDRQNVVVAKKDDDRIIAYALVDGSGLTAAPTYGTGYSSGSGS